MTREFDALIVGAGGSGLYAALEASDAARTGTPAGKPLRTAVLSKVHPMRGHTGAAQGGIGAALGNVEEDRPEWHAFDTVKGGDYLVDQDAAVLLAEDAIRAVYDLENRGLAFSRTPDGRIDQRRFGGHTRNFGEGPVRRSCYAADRTGHQILQTLYQQCIKNGVEFFDEFHVLDVILKGPAVLRRLGASSWQRARFTSSRRRPCFSPPAVSAACSGSRPTPMPTPATARRSSPAAVFPCRIWSSSSSIRRASGAWGS